MAQQNATYGHDHVPAGRPAMSEGIDDHTETKDWVVDVVIAPGEPWAAPTGWIP